MCDAVRPCRFGVRTALKQYGASEGRRASSTLPAPIPNAPALQSTDELYGGTQMGKEKSVTRSRKKWGAIVRFFRKQEKIMRESYGPPNNLDGWVERLKEKDPTYFRMYDDARKAIESIEL